VRKKLTSAYDSQIDAGSVVLTGEQARALVVAVADSIRHGDEILTARMLAAVEALNYVFQIGIEEVDA
jgi:hypothetical protein